MSQASLHLNFPNQFTFTFRIHNNKNRYLFACSFFIDVGQLDVFLEIVVGVLELSVGLSDG